jgi:ATP-dependent exoDNAse (exonuclease V) beta subunit
LHEEERRVFEMHRRRCVEESLSLLYVALTRAVYALHLYIPGPRTRKSIRKDAWYMLLMQALCPEKAWTESTVLFDHGNASWNQLAEAAPKDATALQDSKVPPMVIPPGRKTQRRGWEHVAPSRREGQGQLQLQRLFDASRGAGMAAGVLHHIWFAGILWLDEGLPTRAGLRAQAEKVRAKLPHGIWQNIDEHMAAFQTFLEKPEIARTLRRSTYSGPEQCGFPSVLASLWQPSFQVEKVERELHFLVPDGTQFWDGAFDRIVWISHGGRTVAADLIDFKTDAINPKDTAALDKLTEHYRPQIEIYRRAAARLASIPEECIAARLVLANAGCVRDV